MIFLAAFRLSCLAVALAFLSAVPTLRDVARSRDQVWCPTCPGGRLKVVADFRFRPIVDDPATGADYFPISDLTGRVVNLERWTEESTRAAGRYRVRVVTPTPPSFRGKPPATFDETCLFDGETSWKYRPRSQMAERYSGATKPTRISEDYYGDLIGSEIPGVDRKAARTVASGTDRPFDVDKALASGLYAVEGEEVVDGEPCVVVDRPGLDRIWLAPGRSFAVAKREWRWSPGGPLKRRIWNRDFRHVGQGAWLPFEGRMEVFGHPSTHPDRKVGELSAVVRVAEVDVADSAFEPDFPRGTVVVDDASGRRSRFGWSEQETLEAARASHKSDTTEAQRASLAFRPPSPWWRNGWALALAGVASVAAAACLVSWTRTRKGRR